jgi:membrane-bound inhibitor of C-type lysozyme
MRSLRKLIQASSTTDILESIEYQSTFNLTETATKNFTF